MFSKYELFLKICKTLSLLLFNKYLYARSEFATTPEGEIFSKPVQKYEIVPGSPADRLQKWWNKGR